MHAPDPLMRASLPDVDLPVREATSRTPLPFPSVDPITGIATLCGVAPSSPVPVPIPSDSKPVNLLKDMDKSP